MSDRPAEDAIRDDPGASRFVLEREEGTAELVYRAEPGRLVLIHTEVPDALGGHGIGGRLVQAAVARARHEGVTLVPWCPFARTWIDEHPDAVAGVVVDRSGPPE